MQTSQTSHTPTSNTPEEEPLIAKVPLQPELFLPYTVQITDEWETEDGCGFTGDVLFNGQLAFSFENDGKRDENKYLPHGQEGKDVLYDFKELSKENFPDRFEPVDYALIYLELRDQEENL